MSQPQQSMAALAGTVISPADHAVLGAQMASAGLSESEVSNLIGLVERAALEAAHDAARWVALSVAPVMMKLVRDTHKAAAMEVYRRVSKKSAGLAGLITHKDCAQIALDVANNAPNHVVNH